MLGVFARETLRFAAGLFCAALFAAALAAFGGGALAGRLWQVVSLNLGAPALDDALIASASLLLPGLLLAFAFGVPLGIALAARRTRRFAVPLAQAGGAVPVFCAALGFALLVNALIPGAGPARDASLPAAIASGSANSIFATLAALLPLVLPIGLAGAGAIAAALNRSIAEGLNEPYRESLLRLGMDRREILRVYVVRRALARAVTSLGELMLAAIGATAIVEHLFAWPGAGDMFIAAAARGAWPVVAGLAFVAAAISLAAQFAGAVLSTTLTGTSR